MVDILADSTVAAMLNKQPSNASTAITAAMMRIALRFSCATPTSIMLASAVGKSIAVTAESSISASRANTCLPLSFTREKIVPMVWCSFPFAAIVLDKRQKV